MTVSIKHKINIKTKHLDQIQTQSTWLEKEKQEQIWNKEREGKEKPNHRLIDEDEIINFNPKSIKTILIYLIDFPLMGFWRAKPRLNSPKESQPSP